ncbi:HVO_A0114 family putative DNA-binding protein [Halalkalirubrum salinum]|uniref:HVO_A0114 family putative DNA-binding protein n=1 Tax=Halalkalirubrum salinum TaxID=2563889 RepID=UPI0014856E05|nr:hypothetical protein [Halalkalirubrum salinum]
MTDTPPLHPIEREQLQEETKLVVTVSSSKQFYTDVREAIAAQADGKRTDSPPTIAFESYDDLMSTLTPRVLDLIKAVRRKEPDSINAAARVVDRDVKNVHEELTGLAQLGIIYFVAEGRSKRPVVWFDELSITLPFDTESEDAAAAVS